LLKFAYIRPPLHPAKGCVELFAQRGHKYLICSLVAPGQPGAAPRRDGASDALH